MKLLYRLISAALVLLMLLVPLTGCEDTGAAEASTEDQEFFILDPDKAGDADSEDITGEDKEPAAPHLDEDGSYTSKEDVMNYLIEYHTLPGNFITKKEAKKLGWSGGSLEPYAPGKCIGGDRFGNFEGLLPDDGNVTYHECDIDTLGAKSRGAKRIVYSDEGQIYYTEDHYDTFTLIYEEEEGTWN